MADAATDEFLREERPRALRRVLLECQDHLRRTLHVKMVNKVDTSGVSYAAGVSVADVSASKSSGARRLHQECRLRVL